MTYKIIAHKFSNTIYMNKVAYATFTRVNNLHEFVESRETEPEIKFVIYNGIPIICEST